MKIASRSTSHRYYIAAGVVTLVVIASGMAQNYLSSHAEKPSSGGIVITRTMVSETEEIPYTTAKTIDPSLQPGQVIIVTPGKPGVKKVTYETLSANGKETNRIKKSEQVLYPAVTQVVKVSSASQN